MAKLPLESAPLPQQGQNQSRAGQKQWLSCLVTSTMLIAIIVADALYFWHLLLLFCLISAVMLTILRAHQMTFVAVMVILSFMIGVGATYSEQMRHHHQVIKQSSFGEVRATIHKAEQQGRGRSRLWLSDVSHHDGDRWVYLSGMIRATIDQMPRRPVQDGDKFQGDLRLFPLTGALFPGWPDYGRKSWAEGIIGTAYGRAPIIYHQELAEGGGFIAAIRVFIANAVDHDLSPSSSTLAKALFIGERDFSDTSFYTPFRQAGLAHLLAISGLHMGLFCFGIYGACRVLLSLFVRISAFVGHHKIAVIIALATGLFYLFLAGSAISAIRAYLMTSLILCALLLGRRTVTLRNVNLVCLLFLLIYPSVIYQPAFQLSFAATYGIVIFHDSQKRSQGIARPKWLTRFYYLIATSVMAIAATFVITAYHFGTISAWGTLSNILAIPYTALVIMPAGITYLLALWVGLEWLIAPFFDAALQGLVRFAHFMSGLPLSQIRLSKPPEVFLPLSLFAAIGFYFSRANWCLVIGLCVITGLGLWSAQLRPIGGLTGQDGFIRFAVLDRALLHHNHRLSEFWVSAYEGLLGDIRDVRYVPCRKMCIIERFNLHVIIMHFSDQPPACRAARGVLITTGPFHCKGLQRIELSNRNISGKLFYNSEIGYFLKVNKRPKPERPWRVD